MHKLCVAVAIAMVVGTVAASAQSVLSGIRAGANPPAAASGAMSDSAACQVVKLMTPHVLRYQVALSKEGLVLKAGKNEETVAYRMIDTIDTAVLFWTQVNEVVLHMKDSKATYHLGYYKYSEFYEKTEQLQTALQTLASSARSGRPVVCSDNLRDYDDEFAEFQAKTAAWRALTEKPKVGDEVYKDRLLAEDAVKNRDLNGAAKYYEAGVQADPTWDQGWYNAALVYAELNDYFDAALCMKHYVILMPNAADAQAAKNNIILWAAKADEAAGK